MIRWDQGSKDWHRDQKITNTGITSGGGQGGGNLGVMGAGSVREAGEVECGRQDTQGGGSRER